MKITTLKSILEDIVEEELNEKWEGDVDVEKTGEYADKSISQLKSELEKVKKKSKQYQDKGQDVPDNVIEKEHQILFAIRAKKHWKGGVSEGKDKNEKGDSEEYKKFFMKALKKFGVTEPDQFDSEEKKKEFFDYVDKNWKADKETD